MDNETKDQVNDDYVSIPRLLKGVVVRIDKIGDELAKEQQLLGDKFAEFLQTKLPFDLREAQLFMAVAATPGLDAANFTPPVAVAMPRLLGVYDQILGIWATINGDAAPANNAGTAAASEVVSCPDCEDPAEASVEDNDAQAGDDDTAAAGIVPATDATMATVSDDTADPAVSDILVGTVDTGSQGTAPTVVAEPVVHQPAITAEQRRFIAERSVTLLVKVRKGELTPEEAVRQAEGMPVRKAQKGVAL